jgi:hypothetical protein
MACVPLEVVLLGQAMVPSMTAGQTVLSATAQFQQRFALDQRCRAGNKPASSDSLTDTGFKRFKLHTFYLFRLQLQVCAPVLQPVSINRKIR